MSLLSKILAFILFPIGILIILENLDIYNLTTPFDKALVGAILMVVTQLVTMISLNMYSGNLGVRSYISTVLILLPAFLYFASLAIAFPDAIKNVLPIILGVTMFVEGAYAFN